MLWNDLQTSSLWQSVFTQVQFFLFLTLHYISERYIVLINLLHLFDSFIYLDALSQYI